MTLPVVVTAGEPAGIGPDLCVLLARTPPPGVTVIIADRNVLEARAARLGLAFSIPDFSAGSPAPLSLLNLSAPAPVVPGALDPANAVYVLDTLRRAAQGCLDGEFAALVTAPVHKGVINDAGIAFTGHTEFLAEFTHTPHVVMMLAGRMADGPTLRVALATTHLPLREVGMTINADMLTQTLRILHTSLRRDFGISAPRILVAGLNPHAGEGGHLGREEIDIIEPVLATLRLEGMDLRGPLPADTLFQRKYLADCDAVLAMYHDQGLPVLKHATFGAGVNITLGMPIIRTSVDHGTALDLAGSGNAHDGSLRTAIEAAQAMARTQTLARSL